MLDPQDIAEKIRMRRNELSISQTQLARQANVSLATITRIEQGRCFEVAFGTIIRILNAISYDLNLELGVHPPAAPTTPEEHKEQVLNRYYFGKKA